MASQNSYGDQERQSLNAVIDSLSLNDLDKHFLRSRWLAQTIWMGGRARSARNRYYVLRLTAIILGLIIPVLVSLNVTAEANSAVRLVTIFLSLLVATSAAIEEFFQYGERWRHYRGTAEALKNEGWRFFSRSDPYSQYDTHQSAYPLFVSRVSELMARDVQVYITEIVGAMVQQGGKASGTGSINPIP